MGHNFWANLLYRLPYEIPFWLICAAGILLSIRSWQKGQKRFLFSLIAFSIFFLEAGADFFFQSWIMSRYWVSDVGAKQFANYQNIDTCISLSIRFSAWVILLIALFGRYTNVVAENQPLPVVNQHYGSVVEQKTESTQDLH